MFVVFEFSGYSFIWGVWLLLGYCAFYCFDRAGELCQGDCAGDQDVSVGR